MSDSIAGYPLLIVEGGPPNQPAPLVGVQHVPGADGDLVFAQGEHADPFDLVTDTPEWNLAAAMQTFKNYQALQGTGPVTVVWSGLDLIALWGVQYHVLKVEPLEIDVAAAAIVPREFGGNAPAFVSARWRLQAVRI